MRKRVLRACAIAAVAVLAACKPPTYARYKSVSGDWAAYVPWGWSVVAEADGDAYAQAQFIGPFDSDFFLGAPSLSVRWYKRYRPHALRNDSLEMYADADDFINQMLGQIYGKDADLYGVGRRPDQGRVVISRSEIPEVVLKESHLKAKYFAVLSPAAIPADSPNKWGIEKDPKTGGRFVVRYHEYAVISMPSGFYVLCYPATKLGHDKAMQAFNTLIETFHPYTDGPGGAKFLLPPMPAAASDRGPASSSKR